MTTMTKTEPRTDKEMAASQKHEIAGAETTRPGRVFTPPVDIMESESTITVLADMPGVKPDGLEIDLRDNLLTITGTVDDSFGTDERVLLREYETGSFYRQFRLSNAIDQGRIDAKLDHGVLRLTLPKAEAAKPRRISVTGS